MQEVQQVSKILFRQTQSNGVFSAKVLGASPLARFKQINDDRVAKQAWLPAPLAYESACRLPPGLTCDAAEAGAGLLHRNQVLREKTNAGTIDLEQWC